MSYQVLARKWRPRTFQQMAGQDHVLRPLTHALNSQSLHHAYLFTGTRGVGKTTVARVLAKALNCQRGVSATPCGVCDHCQAIDAGQFMDLIEIDAASRTKVEDTRELLDNIQFLPGQGRYKIYLIDEVHMLSTHSFNALLKTLEEPPSHVKFLLATTDPQKLPVTVLSRCLRFHLRHLSEQAISDYLAHVLEKEGHSFDQKGVDKLAHAAQGSMRDALSLLDQALAFDEGTVTYAGVQDMLGDLDPVDVLQFAYYIVKHDAPGLIEMSQTLYQQGRDFEQALQALMKVWHQVSLMQSGALTEGPLLHHDVGQVLIKEVSAEQVQLYYQIALLGLKDLSIAPDSRVAFEMTLLRMMAFDPVVSSAEQSLPKASVPRASTKPLTSSTALKKEAPQAAVSNKEPTTMNTVETVKPPVGSSVKEDASNRWAQLLKQLSLTGMAQELATHCVLVSENEHAMLFHLAPTHAGLLSPRVQETLAKALINALDRPLMVKVEVQAIQEETPAQQTVRKEQAQCAENEKKLTSHPAVHVLCESLGAKIEKNSIQQQS